MVGAEGVVQVIDGHPQRILLGWLDDRAAQVMLAPSGTVDITDGTASLVSTARAAVAARPEQVDQTGVLLGQPPEEVLEHVASLRRTVSATPFFSDGWRVEMVDLRHIVALQPSVAFDSALSRTAGTSADDLRGLAELTLPLAPPEAIRFAQDARGVWSCCSPNPNLRVLGPACGPMESAGGATVVGYVIGINPSFLQVADVGGRFVLRDGYHRAIGLLAHDIHVVPAFVRPFPTVEGVGGPGLLSASVFMGPRPPVLADFLDDRVTITRFHPAVRKVVVVNATETAVAA